MVSLFGRGFDSLQLHRKGSHQGPFSVELGESGTFFYFASRKKLLPVAGGVGYLFYFASQKRSIPFRLAALRVRSRSHTRFAPIRLNLRYAGACVFFRAQIALGSEGDAFTKRSD